MIPDTWARFDITHYRKRGVYDFYKKISTICPNLQLPVEMQVFKIFCGQRMRKDIQCEPSQVYPPRQAYWRDCLSSRLSFTMVGLCFGLWGSVGTNAVSHHPPGSQLPITVLLFLTDLPANPPQWATVKIQTHLDNAVTLPLKCLSLIVLSERHIPSSALRVAESVLSVSLSTISLTHTNTDTAFVIFLFLSSGSS